MKTLVEVPHEEFTYFISNNAAVGLANKKGGNDFSIDGNIVARSEYVSGNPDRYYVLREKAVNLENLSEELWDKYSQHIDSDIDSLQMIAGSVVLTRRDYDKLIQELLK